jgi:uncharacterized membrane protein
MKFRFDNDKFDPMVNDPENYRLGIFYFNRKDKRTIVPKRMRMLGWTFNFARPGAYMLVLGIVALLVFIGVIMSGR